MSIHAFSINFAQIILVCIRELKHTRFPISKFSYQLQTDDKWILLALRPAPQPRFHILIVVNALSMPARHCHFTIPHELQTCSTLNLPLFLVFSKDVTHLPTSPSQNQRVIVDSFFSFFQAHSVSKWKNKAFQKLTQIFLQFYFLVLFVFTIKPQEMLFPHFVSFFKLLGNAFLSPFSSLTATDALRFK